MGKITEQFMDMAKVESDEHERQDKTRQACFVTQKQYTGNMWHKTYELNEQIGTNLELSTCNLDIM